MHIQEYEAQENRRAEEDAKPLDEQISRFVNTMSDGHRRAKALGRVMARDHRTLVQTKMNVVMSFLKELSQNYKEGRYDARNEASCRLANKMLACLDKSLPYI